MNVWIEKTLVEGRPDRESGAFCLGKALWSPQRDLRGADIYSNMREVKKGDIIFHFIDNQKFCGVSVVEQEHDDTFVGLPGTEWKNRKAYLVKLKDYKELEQPIDRDDLFGNEKHKTTLVDIQNHNTVFYTQDLNLRQGAYITKAPTELISIMNEIYFNKTGTPLPFLGGNLVTVHKEMAQCKVTNDPLYFQLLMAKKQIILYGPPGTGKTYYTKKIAIGVIRNVQQDK